MEVEVTGTPTPEVRWLKDETPVGGERVTVRADGTRHTLVIARVAESDSGRYTVAAVNRAGEAVTLADLVVSPAVAFEQHERTERMAVETTSVQEREQWRAQQTTTTTTTIETRQIVSSCAESGVERRRSESHRPLKLDVTLRADQTDGQLVPEPAPAMDFAPKSATPGEVRARMREDFIEKARRLEEASKAFSPVEVPGGVRLLPPPAEESPKIATTAQEARPEEPMVLASVQQQQQKESLVSKFEPFPDLEPFPFAPDPPKAHGSPKKTNPPCKPSKFVKGDSKESDYESDLETRIPPRWVPPGSDTDDSTMYKKVRVRFSSEERRAKQQAAKSQPEFAKEVTPPSQFDKVPVIEEPPRPQVLADYLKPSETASGEEMGRPAAPIDLPVIQAQNETIYTRSSVTTARSHLETGGERRQVQSQTAGKPSAQALAMEKTWGPKRCEDGRPKEAGDAAAAEAEGE